MTLYDFRLRFNFPESYRIDSDAERLELLVLDTGEHIRLRSGAIGVPIKTHPQAAILGGPFVSEAQAISAAEKSKHALLYWAIEQRLGIDFVDFDGGKPRSLVTNAGLALLQAKYGCSIRNDLHGIDVYEHVDNLKFVSFNASAIVGKAPHNLINTFSREYLNTRQVSEKLLLASEIYVGSFFDVSPRSRFITLVTAVEALSDRTTRPDEVQSLVKEFKTKVGQLRIDETTKASIIGSLSSLRYQSIGEEARTLTRRLIPDEIFGGQSSVSFFNDSYSKRSQLVHCGMVGQSVDISNLANEMERFVALLLLKSLNRQP